MHPQERREQLQDESTPSLKRRRAIIGLSLLGAAAMGAVSLKQTGVVSHLPDPPIKGFDSDSVNSSDTAYLFGAPDGPITFSSLASNLPLAAWGEADGQSKLISTALAGKALSEAAVAVFYFLQMPLKEKKWCAYCIAAALCQWSIAALAVAEAKHNLARE